MTAAALAGVAFACAPAQAQEAVTGIEQRVESVFAIVPENSLELAVPLSRRALTRRAAVEAQAPAISTAKVAQDIAPPAPEVTAAIPFASAPAAALTQTIQVTVDTRTPRPRPDGANPTALINIPLDLVAGAALLEEEQGSADPQDLLPPKDTAASDPPPSQAAPVPVAALAPPIPPALQAPPAAPAPDVAARPAPGENCLTPERVTDKDGDFARNAASLAGFCITETEFKERRRPWDIQVVESGRPGPLWAVVHDDENVAFDNAAYALKAYGGTLISVETGGKRNQDGIDPNRNFSADGVGCAKIGDSAAPRFTGLFKAQIDPAQPIIALHNNHDGPVPTGGLGHVSMKTVPKGMRKSPATDPDGPLAGEHALVLLASGEPTDGKVQTRMASLNGRGINVVLEPVSGGNGDCSLSNYAVLSGHPDYLNVTVDHDEGAKQRQVIDIIMSSSFTVSAAR